MIDAGHTNKQYDHKLRALKDAILLMGYQAERMIADSIRALKEQRLDVAQEVINRRAQPLNKLTKMSREREPRR